MAYYNKVYIAWLDKVMVNTGLVLGLVRRMTYNAYSEQPEHIYAQLNLWKNK